MTVTTIDSKDKEARGSPPFVLKLRKLVRMCPPEVARWSEDGTRFDVIRSEAFADLVCDEFGKGDRSKARTVMRTFIRQLQFYAFRKVSSFHAHNAWGFWHPHFLRDDVARQALIKRYARASQRDEEDDPFADAPVPGGPVSYAPTVATQPAVSGSVSGSGSTSTRRARSASDEDAFSSDGGADDARLVDELQRKVASLELTVQDLTAKLSAAEAKNRALMKRASPASPSSSAVLLAGQPHQQQPQQAPSIFFGDLALRPSAADPMDLVDVAAAGEDEDDVAALALAAPVASPSLDRDDAASLGGLSDVMDASELESVMLVDEMAPLPAPAAFPGAAPPSFAFGQAHTFAAAPGVPRAPMSGFPQDKASVQLAAALIQNALLQVRPGAFAAPSAAAHVRGVGGFAEEAPRGVDAF